VLLQNGATVTSQVTDQNGQTIFSNVPFGSNYSLSVTAAGFSTATPSPFDVNSSTPATFTIQLSSTPPVGTATISGTITGDVLASLTPINITLYRNGTFINNMLAVIPTGTTASFSFSNLPFNSGAYTIVVNSEGGEFPDTTYGPIDIGSGDITNLNIPILTSDQITNLGVPPPPFGTGTSTVVLFPPTNAPTLNVAFSIDGISSTAVNGVQFLTGVATGSPVVLTGALGIYTYQLALTPVPEEYTVVRISTTTVSGSTALATKR
jgi:hypothetical protein